MNDRVKQVVDRIKDVLNKYTLKQKIIVGVLIGAIAIAIVLVSYFVYVQLAKIEDAKMASEIIQALETEGIPNRYKATDATTVIEVEQEYLSDATLLIESSDALSSGMTWEEALDNDMSTTASEKRTKTTLALQTSLRKALLQYEGIQDASVLISVLLLQLLLH